MSSKEKAPEQNPKLFPGLFKRGGAYLEKKFTTQNKKDAKKNETHVSHSNSLDSKSHSMSSPERKKHIPNRPVGVDSLVTDLQARQDKSIDRISRTDIARTFLHYMDVPERAAIVNQPGGASFEHQINNYTLNDIAPVLQNILSNGEDQKKLEQARAAIREQFGKDIEELLGKNVSDWSKSDSWVYGGVAEKRLLRQRREVAKIRKLSIPEHDPLTGDGAEQEWENVGNRQLGWEARFQSWKLKNVRGKMEFEFVEPNPILAKLDKSRPEYTLIKKILERPYREPHAGEYDLKHNPPALIAENFTSDELQHLGEMIRTNLESKKAVEKEETDKAAEAERKKDPWADAPTYGAGDQIIYRRPTGEWAVGTVVEPPEEGSRGQRKFKVTNSKDGKEEEYSAPVPPRFFNSEAGTTTKITIGKKEYSVTNEHMGTNRVEFDLVDEAGKKIPNVDAEVVVAARRAQEVSGKIKDQVDKLQELVKKGVADRSTKIGTTLSQLTTRAQDVEKLLGNSSRWNKLLPERAKEIQDEITKIQGQFEVNVAELTGEVEGIHKTSEKTSESLNKKLAADQVEAAFTTRLQQLDALLLGSKEYKDWQDRVAKYEAYLQAVKKEAAERGDKRGDKRDKDADKKEIEKVPDPGLAPEMPSASVERRRAVYAEIINALPDDNVVRKELGERLVGVAGIDGTSLLTTSELDQHTKDVADKSMFETHIGQTDKQVPAIQDAYELKKLDDQLQASQEDEKGAREKVEELTKKQAEFTEQISRLKKEQQLLADILVQEKIDPEYVAFLRKGLEAMKKKMAAGERLEKKFEEIDQEVKSASEEQSPLDFLQAELEKMRKLKVENKYARIDYTTEVEYKKPISASGLQEKKKQELEQRKQIFVDDIEALLPANGSVQDLEDILQYFESSTDAEGLKEQKDKLDEKIGRVEGELKKVETKLAFAQNEQQQAQDSAQQEEQNINKIRAALKDSGVFDRADKMKIEDILSGLDAAKADAIARKTAAQAALAEIANRSTILEYRVDQVRGRLAEEIVGKWREIKIEAAPRVDIAVQKDEARDKAKNLQDRIARLAPNPATKTALEQRGIELARLVASVSTTKPEDAEKAIAELWANQIRALEVDVFAQELHTKPERQGDYETLIGRTELPGALIADLLREGEPETTRELRAILENIYEHTLEQATITAPPNNTEYTCVKPDSKTTAMIVGLMEKTKEPDAATLSRFGVREWGDLLKVWKKYAPQIGMYLQESARVAVGMEVRRKEREELAKLQAIQDAEAKRPKARVKGFFSKINPARLFRGSATPAQVQLSAEEREKFRVQAREELKNIDLKVLFDQMGTRISAAMGRINTEFRINQASTLGEKTSILSLGGLTARDRTQAFVQGEFVMAENEGYRLKRTVDDDHFPALQELDAAGYKKAQRDVQGAIDKMRVKLSVLYSNRRDDRATPAYDERKKKFQDTIKGLEKDSAVLVGILNREASADKAMVAIGNADPLLYDQISSVLLEARQYLQVDAAELTTPEKELISAKMREGVAKVAAATEAAKAADTSGEAEKVHHAMTEADHGGEGHGGDHGHGAGDKSKKNKKSDPLVRWAAVIALTTSSVIGFAGYKVKKDFEADSRARIESLRGGHREAVAINPDFKAEFKLGSFNIKESHIVGRYGDPKENRYVENPIVSSKEPVNTMLTDVLVGMKHSEEARNTEATLTDAGMDRTGLDTEQGKKARQKDLSDAGKGNQKFGWMFDIEGNPRDKYKTRAEEMLKLAKAATTPEGKQKLFQALAQLGREKEKITPPENLQNLKNPNSGLSLYTVGDSEVAVSSYIQNNLFEEFIKSKFVWPSEEDDKKLTDPSIKDSKQIERNKKILERHSVIREAINSYLKDKKDHGDNFDRDKYLKLRDVLNKRAFDQSTLNPFIAKAVDLYLPSHDTTEKRRNLIALQAVIRNEAGTRPWSISLSEGKKSEKGHQAHIVYGAGPAQTHAAIPFEHGDNISPLDPENGIKEGALELAKMLEKYNGNLDLALLAYNWGHGNVDGLLAKAKDGKSLKDAAEQLSAGDRKAFYGSFGYVQKVKWTLEWYTANGENSEAPDAPEVSHAQLEQIAANARSSQPNA
jgi:hypothetical protein